MENKIKIEKNIENFLFLKLSWKGSKGEILKNIPIFYEKQVRGTHSNP